MRRWLLKDGVHDADGLILEDVPMPEPGPGEVRVRIHAVSLNYRDQFVLTTPEPWRVPGRDLVPVSDGAGEIDKLGAGVDAWAVGDRVTPLYFRNWAAGRLPSGETGNGLGSRDEDGLLAEYVVLPASRLARAPETLDLAEASTLPCAGLTAWSALQGDIPLGPDTTVLVLGSGGVSLFAMALARASGARVVATTGDDGKRAHLVALGASDVVNYRTTPEWGAAVAELTGGADLVVNSAGAREMDQSLTALRRGGQVSLLGLFSIMGESMDPALLLFKGATVRAIGVGSAAAHADMVRFIDAHDVRPTIARRFRFEDAKAAYRAQTSSDTFGKIVIDLV